MFVSFYPQRHSHQIGCKICIFCIQSYHISQRSINRTLPSLVRSLKFLIHASGKAELVSLKSGPKVSDQCEVTFRMNPALKTQKEEKGLHTQYPTIFPCIQNSQGSIWVFTKALISLYWSALCTTFPPPPCVTPYARRGTWDLFV